MNVTAVNGSYCTMSCINVDYAMLWQDVCPTVSVHLSVLSHASIVSKWLTYPQAFFTIWHLQYSSFSVPSIMAIF